MNIIKRNESRTIHAPSVIALLRTAIIYELKNDRNILLKGHILKSYCVDT